MSHLWLPGATTRRGWNRPTVVHDDPDPDPGEQQAYYTEDAYTDFVNPDRGWYASHWGRTWGTRTPNQADTWEGEATPTSNLSVGSEPVRVSTLGRAIGQWRFQDLPSSFLTDLGSALAAMRGTNTKCIVRFYYGGAEDDAPFEWVMRHIEQVAPYMNTYKDCIYMIQAGFIGMWGEWHSSAYNLISGGDGNGTYWRQILDQWLTSTDDDLFITLRRPAFIYLHLGSDTLTRSQAFTSFHKARLGGYNDCLLWSTHDMWTFESQAEIDYQVANAPFMPYGGETCLNSGEYPHSYSDGTYADWHFRRLGLDYLHSDYHLGVLYKLWHNYTSGDYRHTDGVPLAPDGSRWLSWISRHLGYRFVLDRVVAPETVQASSTVSMTVRMSNVGYGTMTNKRPLKVVFTRSGDTQYATAEADFRTVMPLPGDQEDIALSFTAPSGLASGQTYALALQLPDNSAHWSGVGNCIRFANSGVWSSANGWNLLNMNVSVPA